MRFYAGARGCPGTGSNGQGRKSQGPHIDGVSCRSRSTLKNGRIERTKEEVN